MNAIREHIISTDPCLAEGARKTRATQRHPAGFSSSSGAPNPIPSMKHPLPSFHRLLVGLISLLLFIFVFAAPAPAQSSLKVIEGPEGGRIIYGPVPGEDTEAGAMGWILRSLHKEFGDRPQVGKLFQVRGTQSVAAYFSLTNLAHGGAPWTGLMIVTKTATDRVEAGAFYQTTARFPANFNPMMKALLAAWHPFAAPGVIPPLHKFVARDKSASIDIPDGWKPDMTSGGGTIGADGPNGEHAAFDLAFNAMDTRNRAVQQTMRTLQQGGLRNTSYAQAYYCPWDADLGKMFIDTVHRYRRQYNLPDVDIHIDSQSAVPGGQSRCAHILAHLGPPNSKNEQDQREINAVISVGPPANHGGYTISLFYTGVPVPLADQERAMLAAIFASFQVDWAIVKKEAHDYAAPAIDRIHEIGRISAENAKAAHERNDIQNSSVYRRWDSQDKRNQAFGNYLLEQSVVRDADNTEHRTLWNTDAERLIKQFPDKFEYVETPGYWKGVDY